MSEIDGWLSIWILFSVILGLAHLVVGLIVWRMHTRRRAFHLMFRDGCLLFFAMPLVATAFGELLIAKSWAKHPLTVAAGVAGLAFILLIAGAIYSVIVTHDCLRLLHAHHRDTLDARWIYHNSLFLSIAAVGYGVYLTGLRLGL